jgi:hypothetical protein
MNVNEINLYFARTTDFLNISIKIFVLAEIKYK